MPSKLFYQDLITNPETPATILHMLIVKLYGTEVYVWEPETLWMCLIEDLYLNSLDDIPNLNRDRIQAVITLLTTSKFYDQWEVFETIGKTFNYQHAHFEDMTPLSSEELVWTVLEADLNDGEGICSYSHDVLAYMEAALIHDGIATVPEYLKKYLHNYPVPEEYDKKVEAQKQARIVAYCLINLREIKKLAKQYFDLDMRDIIKKDLGIILDEEEPLR